ncbi:hypothetical protein ACFLZ6_00105 [Nanoarchaeota archaeon]
MDKKKIVLELTDPERIELAGLLIHGLAHIQDLIRSKGFAKDFERNNVARATQLVNRVNEVLDE